MNMPKRKPKRQGRTASAPLLSWDIFMQGYHRRMHMGEDLQKLKALSTDLGWQVAWDLQQQLVGAGKVIVVTDLNLKIVFASSNMVEMTGYLPKEVIGQTPKMFQGAETSEQTRAEVRKAVEVLQPFHVSLINYKRNGVAYNCEVEAYPVYNREGKAVNFIAFENAA
jgi:PAS domain S-box-containing protein